ncbi:PREDICTED: polycystic kidney disease protein 1-like 1 [Miniopterus natalensis]|uniref:polycystic kidney disease protein 1-like 1 n=1 Tax=Miniopterus natalensis TaxID=291302 RepID=UPI0007A6B7EB|nr:PREDICTED: polycystic kidney disease protein 1-like 1 [Miniopterus natalensis]
MQRTFYSSPRSDDTSSRPVEVKGHGGLQVCGQLCRGPACPEGASARLRMAEGFSGNHSPEGVAISVHTNGTVFATDADITFVAVTKETTPLEFTWFFGEDPPVRTTRSSVRRRLRVPGWYRVVVQASNGISCVASEPLHVQVQSRVVPSRLAAVPSALVNATVAFECRINFGTDVAYLWDFGDGASGLGNSSASHVYSREGDFMVEVLAFNAVSAASLRKRLFVVHRPCQPPPVKNMGPGRVQVWRSQPVTLGVTFDGAVLCDISQGLSYTWSLTDSTGSQVPLPPAASTHRRTVTIPGYFLEPGNYTALAKVQVEGSPVHSNYCVAVEVRARAPVSVISEGTHLFIPRTPSSTVLLRGSLSYDPDRPGAALRYHWTCTPASTPGRLCFSGPSARSLDTAAPTLSFPADSLSSGYDQFLVTLTVSSHGRNSSEAQVFLSTLHDPERRLVSISWVTFRGLPVNWNEGLSLRAACEDCGEAARLSYSWDLFLVNATGRDAEEVPFCRAVGLLGSSGLAATSKLSESYPLSPGPLGAEPRVTPVPSSWEPWPGTLGRADLSATGRTSTEFTVTVHHIPAAGDTKAPDGDPWDKGPPGSPTHHPPGVEADYGDIQEAVSSGGRQPGDWTSFHLPGSGQSAGADESRGAGDNLVGPFLPTAGAGPALLVDWPKSPVSRAVFRGYTSSGVTGQTLTVKPYSLSPGGTYVLQAAVASGLSLLGKAQLYVTVNPAPENMACQVQPPRGLEADTIFGVFCMAGRPDFRYEFSYRIGGGPQHTLYRGTDAQHYFSLPAGEPGDGYQVLVSTVITDSEGSRTQPCTVAVTVLPRVRGDPCPGEDVYNSSLRHLSTLQLMGREAEIRNYVAVTAAALSRWAEGGGGPSCGQWARFQDALISSVCGLASRDQEEVADSVRVLRGLLRFPSRLSLASASLILGHARSLLAPRRLPACAVVRGLVLLASGVLEVTGHHPWRSWGRLLEEGAQVISDALGVHCPPGKHGLGPFRLTRRLTPPVSVWPGLLQGCLPPGGQHQLHLSTGRTEVHARLHRHPRSSLQSLGAVRVRFPADLAGPEPRSPCYVSQLLLLSSRSSPRGRAPRPAWGYLSLLDADFDRDPPNKPLAEAVNYTVRLQGARCLLWDTRRREPESSLPQPGAAPGTVNCSYHSLGHLTAFSVSRRDLNTSFETGDLSQFQGPPENLLPSIFIVAFTILYVLLVTKSNRVDRREKNKAGYIFLQENTPPGHQLYAVVVDTGFRAPAHFTAKVYVVLCGERGLSDPRELSCPKKPLFERNSRHTFILSTPAPLGQLRKIRLWHDSHGASPAWFVSHVMVRELRGGSRGWFFPAECWLAAGRRDGRVERELVCLRGGLGFRKLLFSKFTELLEDLHVWASAHSRPSGRGLLHTPRLSVAFALLCAYACLAALATAAGHEQLPLGVGPASIPLGSFRTGFLCTLLASPGAQLLSLLFRLSQVPVSHLMTTGPAKRSHACPWEPRQPEQCRQNTSAVLSGRAQAQSSARGDGAAHPSSQPEAHEADLVQPPPREKSDHCVPSLRGDSGGPGHAFEGLAISRWPRVWLPWLRSAAWAICGTISVACGLGTGFIGYRFGPTQCAQWLCLLTVSVTCCVFVTQPLMVGLAALGIAWRRRDDESFFTESLREATEGLDADLEGLSSHAAHDPRCGDPHGTGTFERVLAERQRARRLRRARPPSAARLRVTRERMRRRTRTRAALRDTGMCILMLLLHLLIVRGTASRGAHSLRRAVRDAFTRGTRSTSSSPSGVDTWWDWSLTTLLDGLYRDGSPTAGSPGAQPGALGGTCYLIGPPVLKQLKLPPGRACELPGPLSALTEDSLPTCDPKIPSMRDAEIQKVAPSDPEACREDCELILGRTRSTARTALTGLRARRWVDGSTRAVSVHFLLYNPPTRLFSSVSLRSEMLPARGLALSSLVQSVTVFHGDSAPRCHLLLPQLAFLVLTLTHLSLQLFCLADKGVRSYWQKPGNWLELPIAGAGLAWCAASGHLLSLAAEVADQLHRGFLQRAVDLSHVALWSQRARWLQGTLSFLLTLKCLRLLGSHSAVASCTLVTRRSLSGVLAPALAGVLVLAADAHLRGIPLFPEAPPPGTFTDAVHRLLFRVPGSGRRGASPSLARPEGRARAGCYALLLAAAAALWLGTLRGSLVAFAPKRKSFQSPSLVGPGDVTAYVWGKVCSALGRERPAPEEAEPAGGQTPSLDEFADLVDELLLKVNGLSDRLQLPHPEPQPWDSVPAGPSEDRASGPEESTGLHSFKSKVFRTARVCGVCKQVIDGPGVSCRGGAAPLRPSPPGAVRPPPQRSVAPAPEECGPRPTVRPPLHVYRRHQSARAPFAAPRGHRRAAAEADRQALHPRVSSRTNRGPASLAVKPDT